MRRGKESERGEQGRGEGERRGEGGGYLLGINIYIKHFKNEGFVRTVISQHKRACEGPL
jgi:hypothetical protein